MCLPLIPPSRIQTPPRTNTTTHAWKAWSRGRRESGNTAEQWASDLRTISTIFACLAVEGSGEEGNTSNDARLYNDIFQRLQRRVYSYEGTIRQFLVDDKGMVLIACYGIVAHENDAERATRCAMGISNDLLEIGITSSAGVTTVSDVCVERGIMIARPLVLLLVLMMVLQLLPPKSRLTVLPSRRETSSVASLGPRHGANMR